MLNILRALQIFASISSPGNKQGSVSVPNRSSSFLPEIFRLTSKHSIFSDQRHRAGAPPPSHAGLVGGLLGRAPAALGIWRNSRKLGQGLPPARWPPAIPGRHLGGRCSWPSTACRWCRPRAEANGAVERAPRSAGRRNATRRNDLWPQGAQPRRCSSRGPMGSWFKKTRALAGPLRTLVVRGLVTAALSCRGASVLLSQRHQGGSYGWRRVLVVRWHRAVGTGLLRH